MGVVYAAHDERLDRAVAIKRIRPGGRVWTEAPLARGARRGQRQPSERLPTLRDRRRRRRTVPAMELLDGEPLSARLEKGPLPPNEAAQITLSVLSALTALHDEGIVHRDLKPSNIFLSKHGVKLLDFGISRAFAGADGTGQGTVTQPGLMIGTPRYMAPEQIQGTPVDLRSDLFSLGMVLYEMVAGRPPFGGESIFEVAAAILHDEPPALGGSSSIVALDRIIHRALRKQPDARYQTAAVFAQELRSAMLVTDSGEASVRPVTRLVVLPFRVLRPDPSIDFLAFSLADAISSAVSGLPSLVVRSTAAAAGFATGTPDFPALARALDVDVVLLGTLLSSGEQVRVSAQLVQVPSGTLVRAITSQATSGEIFQLQDGLAQSIVESLSLSLTPASRVASIAMFRPVPKRTNGICGLTKCSWTRSSGSPRAICTSGASSVTRSSRRRGRGWAAVIGCSASSGNARVPAESRPRRAGAEARAGHQSGPAQEYERSPAATMLALRLTRFEHLVDIGRVDELRASSAATAPSASAPAPRRRGGRARRHGRARPCPLLARATPFIGHFQIRNRGTSAARSPTPTRPPSTRPSRSRSMPTFEVAVAARPADDRRRATSSTGCGPRRWSDDELLVARSHFPVWSGRCGFAVAGVRPPARRLRHRRRRGRASSSTATTASRAAAIGLLGMGSTPCAPARPRQALIGTAPSPTRRSRRSAARRRRHSTPTADVHASADVPHARRRRAWWRARLDRGASRRPRVAEHDSPAHGQRQRRARATVEARTTLADFLREDCGLTGTHLGCEHGVCGACTVLRRRRGRAVVPHVRGAGRRRRDHDHRGHRARPTARSRPCRRRSATPRPAVRVLHPGLRRDASPRSCGTTPTPTDDEIREALSGNLCRCTGYQGIIAGRAARRRRRPAGEPS